MLSGVSIWQLLILLAIVVMIFGTKRLKNLGGDLGGALRDFRSSMKDGDDAESKHASSGEAHAQSGESRVIDQEAENTTAHPSDETASHDRTP